MRPWPVLLLLLAFMVPSAEAVTTTTTTIYAQNFPTPTVMIGFVTVLVFVFLIPSVLTAFFDEQGDVAVTIWLFGAFLGGLIGSVAADAESFLTGAYGVVPWGLTFFLGVALVIWIIRGGGH